MSKKKDNVVYHLSKEEATMLKKPKFNAFQCGHGAHGDKKYSRLKAKKELKDIIKNSEDF